MELGPRVLSLPNPFPVEALARESGPCQPLPLPGFLSFHLFQLLRVLRAPGSPGGQVTLWKWTSGRGAAEESQPAREAEEPALARLVRKGTGAGSSFRDRRPRKAPHGGRLSRLPLAGGLAALKLRTQWLLTEEGLGAAHSPRGQGVQLAWGEAGKLPTPRAVSSCHPSAQYLWARRCQG